MELAPSMLMPPKSVGWLVGEVEEGHPLQKRIHRIMEPDDDEFFDYILRFSAK